MKSDYLRRLNKYWESSDASKSILEIVPRWVTANTITAARLVAALVVGFLLNLPWFHPWSQTKVYFFCTWIYGVFVWGGDKADGWLSRDPNRVETILRKIDGKKFDRRVDKIADSIIFPLVWTINQYMAIGLALTELSLFISTYLEDKYEVDASSSDAGQVKTFIRGLSISIILFILASSDGLAGHPYMLLTAILIFWGSIVCGLFSIKEHYGKIFTKLREIRSNKQKSTESSLQARDTA